MQHMQLYTGLLSMSLCLGVTEVRAASTHEHQHAHEHTMPQQSSPAVARPKATHDHSHMQHQSEHVAPAPLSTTSSESLRDPHAAADGFAPNVLGHNDMHEHALATVIADRLESVTAQEATYLTYDWQASYGYTFDKLLLRAEGQIAAGQFQEARNELLWSHAISAFWDTQLGVRYDSGKGTDRSWLAMGIQGLAPYWIYVEATFYVNTQGRTAFRLETEYDLLITQKLILQPRVELNFYSSADASRAITSGLSNVEAGLRLRYEILREIAPYVGLEWAGRLGANTREFQEQNPASDEYRLVAGVHFWY